jgi:hypothetical protein
LHQKACQTRIFPLNCCKTIPIEIWKMLRHQNWAQLVQAWLRNCYSPVSCSLSVFWSY